MRVKVDGFPNPHGAQWYKLQVNKTIEISSVKAFCLPSPGVTFSILTKQHAFICLSVSWQYIIF